MTTKTQAELQARVWAAATGNRVMRWNDYPGAVKTRENHWVVVNKAIEIVYLPDLLTYEGAGKLLEVMHEFIWNCRTYRVNGDWSCEFWNGVDTRVKAEADTMPEAVLLAAARALQVETV